jgi:hypothetical protein
LTLKTFQAYHLALDSFCEHLAKTAPKEFMDEITQGDLDEFRLVLIGQKYQDRSIGNILGNPHCFLIKMGFMVDAKLAKLLPGKLVPVRHQVPKKSPKQYNGELHALMAASTLEDRELCDFLRKSGFREDEAAHAEITDVPGVVMAMAPWAAPHSTAHCARTHGRQPDRNPAGREPRGRAQVGRDCDAAGHFGCVRRDPRLIGLGLISGFLRNQCPNFCVPEAP